VAGCCLSGRRWEGSLVHPALVQLRRHCDLEFERTAPVVGRRQARVGYFCLPDPTGGGRGDFEMRGMCAGTMGRPGALVVIGWQITKRSRAPEEMSLTGRIA